ncbi:MAG: hypothetical protein ACYC56_14555 [Candidatus Aquicultor sp.]
MQGQLRKEEVTITVDTECAHCQKPMKLELDSDMRCRCQDSECHPIIFVPDVDLSRLKDPNIIEAF